MKAHCVIIRLLLGATFFLASTVTFAQLREDTTSVNVFFRYGYSTLDLLFRDNGRRLDDFVRRYQALSADKSVDISGVEVSGFASPEGDYRMNQRLAKKRAEVIAAYLRQQLLLNESMLTIKQSGIDWEGLAIAVDTLYNNVPARERILDIIRNTPERGLYNGVQAELRKQMLINLDGGREWARIRRDIFPLLRNSAATVCIKFQRPALPDAVDDASTSETSDSSREEVVDSSEPSDVSGNPEETGETGGLEPSAVPATVHKPIVALRSNLLLPLLNVGVEVPLGNRWSVGADYYYPWMLRKDNHKDCFQLIFFSAEARYWFGHHHTPGEQNYKHRLTGHSVGVYGAWGYYDIEHNYRGHQGDGWSAGVDYLYAMPIAKNRLRLEFQLALGFMRTEAQPYNVYSEGGHLFRDRGIQKRLNYFGPTKVGVNLVWPLAIKVKSKQGKEGER